ncbi:MAG: carboxylesterase family protein [Saprospiraceae bacterium]|nr:carboxylesterase family protein [Saprospiraceae bacterium]
MRILILILLPFIIQSSVFCQCIERYKQRYFNNIDIHRDVVYRKDAPSLIASTVFGETLINKDLVMDIFMPTASDTVTNRPVVVIGHGGGFVNVAFMSNTIMVGTMDNDDVQALADTLAHWGYVAAVIEYRLGYNLLSSSSINRAVWRGTQDMSSAIRFFRKNASWFGIDPERVFSVGSSAGAFGALHSAFVDFHERDAETYELSPGSFNDLGHLHSCPVVSLSTFDPFSGLNVVGNDVDSIPNGVATYWGAIADLKWLYQGNNKAPIIMFHGTNDLIVDYKCAKPFSNVVIVAAETCGTYMMDSVLTAHNMLHEAYYGQGQNHEYWGALNGEWLPGGPNAYWPDIIQKTADFFYNLMKPEIPLISGPNNVIHSTNYSYTILNPLPGYTYCWEVGGGVIVSPVTNSSTIDVQFYNTTNQGYVTARAIDSGHFVSEKAVVFTIVTTDVDNITKTPSISTINLKPNPAKKRCIVSFISSLELEGQLLVYNAFGVEVFNNSININIGENHKNLDLDKLNQGIYFVEVRTPKTKVVERLIIY